MPLSDELQEASRTYYYLRSKEDKTIGGPYKDIAGLGKGVLAAVKRGFDRYLVKPQKLVAGQFTELSVDETEALVASME